MPKPVKRDSQKGRIMTILLCGRPKTMAAFGQDAYTMRNRIGELETDGYEFERFSRWHGGRLTAYRFAGPRPVVWA